MRTWIGIGAAGLLAFFAGIWGLGGLEAVFPPQRPSVTSARQTISPDAAAAGRVGQIAADDPLVPPARVPGLPAVPAGSTLGADPVNTVPGSFLSLVSFGDPFVHDDRAFFHPHGQQVCPSGCAASRHPTGELTGGEFQELMAQFAHQPMDETSPAFETLLYYGRQTKAFVDIRGTAPLDPVRAAALRRELSRTHAKIAIRVVDEYGVIRASLPPTRVPLDRRHVFEMETNNVQPLETSGTVKRVGLYHLWNRL